MDVSRSVNALKAVARGLKALAWAVAVVFAAAAIRIAFAVSFIPADVTKAVEDALPGTGLVAGVVVLIVGAINWLVLLGLSEAIYVFLAIEANTRAAAGTAAVEEPVAAGAAE